MFMFHTAMGILLLALVAAVALFVWSKREGSGLGKATGLIIGLLALLNIICTGYYGMHMWKSGYFAQMSDMHMKMMEKKQDKMGTMNNNTPAQ